MSMMSSEIWNAVPTMPPRRLSRSTWSASAAGEHRAEPAGRADQAGRLLVHHLQVLLDGVRPVDRSGQAAGLAHLTGHQLRKRLGDEPHRVRPQPRDQPRRGREQVVAGQDRHVVAPADIGGGRAAADLRLVHDVVVVERGQVHQLDDRAGDGHLGGLRVRADLRRQNGEQRPEPLAARHEQVRQRLGHHLVCAAQLRVHELLDPRHAVTHGRPRTRRHRSQRPLPLSPESPPDQHTGERGDQSRRGGRGRRTCRVRRRPPGPPGRAATCWSSTPPASPATRRAETG